METYSGEAGRKARRSACIHPGVCAREQGLLDISRYDAVEGAIIILKGLPVLQCSSCNQYLLDDRVMKRVDEILTGLNGLVELQVIKYAA